MCGTLDGEIRKVKMFLNAFKGTREKRIYSMKIQFSDTDKRVK